MTLLKCQCTWTELSWVVGCAQLVEEMLGIPAAKFKVAQIEAKLKQT